MIQEYFASTSNVAEIVTVPMRSCLVTLRHLLYRRVNCTETCIGCNVYIVSTSNVTEVKCVVRLSYKLRDLSDTDILTVQRLVLGLVCTSSQLVM